MLLPWAEVTIQGFLDIDKVFAASAGALLGTLLFCTRQITSFRPKPGDGLLLLFAAATVVTSLDNDLGLQDGLSSAARNLLWYGTPYFFGRIFLRTRGDLLEAAKIIVGVAAVYGLMALWEWRMSPQLHHRLYGFLQHSWLLGMRWGFYRPILCFPSNLGLGTFFAWTGILAVWMLRGTLLPAIAGLPPLATVGAVLVGLLTSMSFGPWGIFLAGLALLFAWERGRRRLVPAVPLLFALLWMAGRYTAVSDGEWLTSAVAKLSGPRAASLQYRIDAETELLDKAKLQPVFGWGGWGRNRIHDEEGKSLVATDGLWVIYVGTYGLVGLATFFAWWCYPLGVIASTGRDLRGDALTMAASVAVGLHAVSFLFNAFLDPAMTMMAGGVVTQLGAAPQIVTTCRAWGAVPELRT